MTSVAVLAHAGKSLGGGLGELREVLAREGVADPLWYEVPKSKKAPKQAPPRGRGAAPTSSSSGVATAWCSAASTRWPAPRRPWRSSRPGTANLLATNLGIPKDLDRGGATSACTAPTARSTSA